MTRKNDWTRAVIAPTAPLMTALERINGANAQIALVADAEGRLLGTVTDGDVRRAILAGHALDVPVQDIMKRNPIVGRPEFTDQIFLNLMREHSVHQLPVVDQDGRLVDLILLDELISEQADYWVVLMAGGLGSRLRPLTENTPKPMLKVGSRPILETILGNLIEAGCRRFFISVNYLGTQIEDHFGDGSAFGVQIDYLREPQQLGTAGALSLLPETPSHPLIVMNSDVLTKIDYRSLLRFHKEHDAPATMCVRPHEVTVPYGVANIDGHQLQSIDEKPTHKFFINAGIYVLSPQSLDLIPREQKFDMTDLFNKVIETGQPPAVFPVQEYWIDVGRMEDFTRAELEFHHIFGPL